jgi:hypothetical protein
MEAITGRLKKHDAQIQKVSAQLEVSKSAPKLVLNNPLNYVAAKECRNK